MNSSSSSDEASVAPAPNTQGRMSSIYNSVAGRSVAQGTTVRRREGTELLNLEPISPDEVLFLREERRRASDMPNVVDTKNSAEREVRREHFQKIYFEARKRLLEPSEGSEDQLQLPSSDILKALHSYASDYYFALAGGQPSIDFLSMDETALLAMGILMEEAVEEMLGESGHLVLTEEVETDEEVSGPEELDDLDADIPEKEPDSVADAMDDDNGLIILQHHKGGKALPARKKRRL